MYLYLTEKTMQGENMEEFSSDDDSNCEDVTSKWLLGFIEPPLRQTDLLRHRFPSKVGGRPAWLDPIHLPTIEMLSCPKSDGIMKFLLQVYAPVDENPDAFHRTLFVFVSKDGPAIHSIPGSVKAFRCQLPRSNSYYGYDPPSELDDAPLSVEQAVSGIDPWNVLEYEVNSKVEGSAELEAELFPEYEMVVEPEPNESKLIDREAEIKKYAEVSQQYTEEELPCDVVEDIEKNMPTEQRDFASFATRISLEPSQVLRYCFETGVKPICPSSKGIPSGDSIPPCQHCQGPRKFEFQVMPQLLNSLNVDPLDKLAPDWGMIAVYSCAGSCSTQPADGCSYVEEYVWVQPPDLMN